MTSVKVEPKLEEAITKVKPQAQDEVTTKNIQKVSKQFSSSLGD
jgi:hypothetical protein